MEQLLYYFLAWLREKHKQQKEIGILVLASLNIILEQGHRPDKAAVAVLFFERAHERARFAFRGIGP